MSEQPIDGRPKLPAPEERLALPAPADTGAADPAEDEDQAPRRRWYKRPRF